MDENSYEKIFVCDISYNSLNNAKPFCITFNKVDGFIRAYERTRYLILFSPENMIPFKIGLHIL